MQDFSSNVLLATATPPPRAPALFSSKLELLMLASTFHPKMAPPLAPHWFSLKVQERSFHMQPPAQYSAPPSRLAVLAVKVQPLATISASRAYTTPAARSAVLLLN